MTTGPAGRRRLRQASGGGRFGIAAVAVTGAAAATGAAVAIAPTIAAIVLVLAWTGVGVVAAVRSPQAAAVVYVTSLPLSHLVKRVIFAIGPQPRWLYYGILLVPSVFAVIAASRCRRARSGRAGLSLVVFVATLVVSAALSPVGGPPVLRLATLHERIAPMIGFLVGLTLPLGARRTAAVARAIVLSGIAAVPYGVLQQVIGVGPLERAWVDQTAAYSTAANSIRLFEQLGQPMRSFGWFADHTTWGLWLATSIPLVLLGRRLGWRMPPSGPALAAIAIGLLVTLTRTPLFGVAATFAAYRLLGFRGVRRPFRLVVLTVAAFGIAIAGFNVVYDAFVDDSYRLSTSGNPLAARFGDVGTLTARTQAWDALPPTIAANPLIGNGPAYLELVELEARSGGPRSLGIDPGKHNVLVELTFMCGFPGLVAFLFFIGFVLRSALVTGARTEVRWLIACVLGLVITGYTSGTTFMSDLFFVACGILVATGEQARRDAVQRDEAARPSSPTMTSA